MPSDALARDKEELDHEVSRLRELVGEKEVTGSRQAAELRRLRGELDQLEDRLSAGDSENIHKVSHSLKKELWGGGE